MQKFIHSDTGDVIYLDDGCDLDKFHNPDGFRLMTQEEVLKHETPKPSQFHEWNGAAWVDMRTDEEKLGAMPRLTRYQFFRVLLENNIDESSIESQIQAIPNDYQRKLALLGWNTATVFVRTDPSVLLMESVLEISVDQMNALWNQALTY